MNDAKSIWANLKIDPEVRDLIVLSSADVSRLHQEAIRQPDPEAWLTSKLNERGYAKKRAREIHKQARMADDLAYVKERKDWNIPGWLPMKSQPWCEGHRRFGQMRSYELKRGEWIVHTEDGQAERFESLEKLVEVWSVD